MNRPGTAASREAGERANVELKYSVRLRHVKCSIGQFLTLKNPWLSAGGCQMGDADVFHNPISHFREELGAMLGGEESQPSEA